MITHSLSLVPKFNKKKLHKSDELCLEGGVVRRMFASEILYV